MYTLSATINGESMKYESDDLEELEMQAEATVDSRDEGEIEAIDIMIVDNDGNNVMSDNLKAYIG